MSLSMILASDLNGAIGYNNKLLVHIKEDMEHFKNITMGKVVVMGSKTASSLPNGLPLKGRTNIVMTRKVPQNDLSTPTNKVFIYCSNPQSILDLSKDEEIVIIGGAEIYKLFEDHVDCLYHTIINKSFKDADTFYKITFLSTKTYEQELLFHGHCPKNAVEFNIFKTSIKEKLYYV